MKIVVIGAGAVGGVMAAFLTNEKHQLELVCKHREIVENIANNGLRVEGILGNFITYPDSVIDVSQISMAPDIVFIATKANDAVDSAKAVLPFLRDDTMVVSLQNGIIEDDIAEIVGLSRTIGCVVEWGATMLGAGRLEITSNGRFIIGELNNEITHRLLVLKSILEKMFSVQLTSNIYGALYSKLIINSCITPLGAITGAYLGELLTKYAARSIFMRVFTEAVAVAKAADIKLEKIANKIDPYKFALTTKQLQNDFSLSILIKHLVLLIVGFKYRRLKSSSLQSLERGKPTEIDYLNGYIVRKAKEYNIPVPTNLQIISLVKDIEQSKLKIEFENLFKIL